jgi:hypothetical protein
VGAQRSPLPPPRAASACGIRLAASTRRAAVGGDGTVGLLGRLAVLPAQGVRYGTGRADSWEPELDEKPERELCVTNYILTYCTVPYDPRSI